MKKISIGILILILSFSLVTLSHAWGSGDFGALANYLKRIATSLMPTADNTYSIGDNDHRWTSISSVTYYGDGSHLTGLLTAGSINSGTTSQVPYFAADGNTLTGTSALNTNGTSVGVNTTSYEGRFTIKAGGTGSGVAFRVKNSSSAAKVSILDNGNLGLGTTAPTQVLEVSGTAKATLFFAGNVGIGTSGPTSCTCLRYEGGICTSGSCS